MKYLFLSLFLLFKASQLFAQKVEIMPYVKLHNCDARVDLQKRTRSFAVPADYHAFGGGFGETTLGYGAGINIAAVAKNSFGLQSGVRVSRFRNELYYRESRGSDFARAFSYRTASFYFEVPLHLVYDFGKTGNLNEQPKAGRTYRIFLGPVLSYSFNEKSRTSSGFAISEGTLVFSAGRSEFISQPQLLKGVEFGLNVNPFLKDWLNLGVVFNYQTTPFVVINYESEIEFKNSAYQVRDVTQGKIIARGIRTMVQIGFKPFSLKKAKQS